MMSSPKEEEWRFIKAFVHVKYPNFLGHPSYGTPNLSLVESTTFLLL